MKKQHLIAALYELTKTDLDIDDQVCAIESLLIKHGGRWKESEEMDDPEVLMGRDREDAFGTDINSNLNLNQFARICEKYFDFPVVLPQQYLDQNETVRMMYDIFQSPLKTVK